MASQIGLIGLGIMGSNFARNIASKGFHIVVFNRTPGKTDAFLEKYRNEYLSGENELSVFINTLEKPRKIILFVEAGKPVDAVLGQLLLSLDKGDVIVDCGNSHFSDTKRRCVELQKKGVHFVGCGVSGGEAGALHGPSLMPGGSETGWAAIKEIFEAVAAKDFDGNPCAAYIGANGAGHYVKMVHNGIEYGVMQLMAEVYDILRSIYQLKAPEIGAVFKKFNTGALKSYLLEIAEKVLIQKDEFNNGYLIDSILDRVEQKGTGQWVAIDALVRGVAIPTITEAVYARMLSAERAARREDTSRAPGPSKEARGGPPPLDKFLLLLESALYFGMLSTYAQGYSLIQKASHDEAWDIDLAEVSRIWEGGCIIRAKLLGELRNAYKKEGCDKHVFELSSISSALADTLTKARDTAALALAHGIPIPAFATALMYWESMTTQKLPANFIAALRDYFGAHMYERNDRGGKFHTEYKE